MEAQFFVGRYEDALHTIAISKNAPGFIRIYNVAACIKLGKMDQAREALQEFIKSARKDMLAMPDPFCREYDKAAVHIEKALANNPNDAGISSRTKRCSVT